MRLDAELEGQEQDGEKYASSDDTRLIDIVKLTAESVSEAAGDDATPDDVANILKSKWHNLNS